MVRTLEARHLIQAFAVLGATQAPQAPEPQAVFKGTVFPGSLADHFPSFPVLPGVFMLEAMVQSARLLIPESDQRFVLGGVKALRYGSFVSPGEHLRVEVEMKKFDGELATFRGEGKVISPGGEVADADTAVSGRFTMRPVRTARIAVGARVGGDANP